MHGSSLDLLFWSENLRQGLGSRVNPAAKECALASTLIRPSHRLSPDVSQDFPNNDASAAPKQHAHALPSRPRQTKLKTPNPLDHRIAEASAHSLVARLITERLLRGSTLRTRRGCWSQPRYPTESLLIAPSRRRISREREKCRSTTPTICRVILQRSEAPRQDPPRRQHPCLVRMINPRKSVPKRGSAPRSLDFPRE